MTATTTSEARLKELAEVADKVRLFDSRRPGDLRELLDGQEGLLLSVAPKGRGVDEYRIAYLETAKQLVALLDGSGLKQLVYTSSGSVYGDQLGSLVDEETPPHPMTPQAEILLETESTFLGAEARGLCCCIFRLGEIIGPNRAIEDRVRQMAGRVVPGDGRGFVNLSELSDIVKGIAWAYERHLSGVYNLCRSLPKRRGELYDEISERLKLPRVQWATNLTSPFSGSRRLISAKLEATGFAFGPNL